MPDGSANPDMQVTVRARAPSTSSPRASAALGTRRRPALRRPRPLGGELPPGTRLALGTAVLEVTAEPHTGCAKFHARFGGDAHCFVNVRTHRHLRLRGLNAKVIQPGTVSAGDPIRKL